MSRLSECFAALRRGHRTALIPYIAAGHPDATTTVPLMHALVVGGANVIELGVPFSDPMADGPAVQRAAQAGIAAGVGLIEALHMVEMFRRDDATTPIVLMGYVNSIEHMGVDVFVSRAKAAGVDGLIAVDLPLEECTNLRTALAAVDIDLVLLVAPTTTDARIAAIAALASGYLYYVSLKGTTGAASLDAAAVERRLPDLRRHTDLPIAVGFGIRDAASARAVGQFADGVVIGSRIVEVIESLSASSVVEGVGGFLADIRRALDGTANEKEQIE